MSEEPRNEFSVYRFFDGDYNEPIKRFVSAEEAVKTAAYWTRHVYAHNQYGIARRIIITDGGDCIVFEWIFGEGVVFPPNPQNN